VAWLPDGSGFVFSRVEAGSSLGNPPPAGGAIYEYTFAGGRLRELLRLPGEAIGRLTVSPDGQTLAFERAARLDDSVARVTRGPRLLCPCDLYLAGRNGSNLRLLVRDARAPAWSLVAPSVVPGPPQPAPDPALVPRFFVPLVGG
jgi:Tol biopolymer transport system component